MTMIQRGRLIGLGVCAFLFGSFAAGASGAEMIARWSFDEGTGSTARAAGGGHPGTLHGAGWSQGTAGTALDVDGVSAYVTVPSAPEFALTHLTLSAWIYPRAYPKNKPPAWGGIVGKAFHGESTYGLRLGRSGELGFRVYGPFGPDGRQGFFAYQSRSMVGLNAWHHVAATYDGSAVRFFLDGRLDAVYPETRLPYVNDQDLFIGSAFKGGHFFNGLIDEVKIYRGALSEAEIARDYRESGGTNTLYALLLPEAESPPVADGRLDDPCWQSAQKIRLVANRDGQPPAVPTEVYLTQDDQALYVAFVCREPDPAGLRAEVKDRDGPVWTDDCVELFLDPGLTRRAYCHLAVNSLGVQADSRWHSPSVEDPGWNGRWESRTRVDTNAWTAELALPWSAFAAGGEVRRTMGLNLCRQRKVKSELSSWSPTFGGFHQPERFGVIEASALDPGAYPVSVTETKLVYESGTDGGLGLVLCQTVSNRTDSPRRITAAVEAAAGGLSHRAPVDLAPRGSADMRLPLPAASESGSVYQVEQSLLDGDRCVFFASRSLAAPALVDAWLDRSYYTREASAGLRGRIRIEGPLPPGYSVEAGLVDAGGGLHGRKPARLDGKAFAADLDLRGLPPGEHGCVMALLQDGRTIYSNRLGLLKHPPSAHEAKVDRDTRAVLADGRRFFAMGITGIPRHLMEAYAAAGFNLTTGAGDTCLDTAAHHGMKVMAATFYVVPRTDYATKPADELERLIRASTLPATAAQGRNHPAFLGYFWDEPDEKEVRGSAVLAAVTRDCDPYHLIAPCFWSPLGPSIPPAIYDIDIADLYWSPGKSPDRYPHAAGLDNHVRLAGAARRPFWFMPLAAGWYAPSAITPREQRLQTWLGIIRGARGLCYWTYINTYPAMRAMLKQLAGEVRQVAPALLHHDPARAVLKQDEAGLHALAFDHDGALYLLAALNRGDVRAAVEFRLAGCGPADRAEVLFEDRAVPLQDGTLKDVFEPYGVHVYRLPAPGEAPGLELILDSSEPVARSGARRWPDFPDAESLTTIPNGGFEDSEDGQARIWYPSCSWESPEYCAVDTNEAHSGSASLRLTIPAPDLFSQETGYGWDRIGVSAFDLGGPDERLRDGHKAAGGLFKAAAANGAYELAVVMRTPEDVRELEAGQPKPLAWDPHEIPAVLDRFPAAANRIREYRSPVVIGDGSLDLSVGAADLFALSLTSAGSSEPALRFDFGAPDSPAAPGWTPVRAPLFSELSLNSVNGDTSPRVPFAKGQGYVLSLFARTDGGEAPLSVTVRGHPPFWGVVKKETAEVAGTAWREIRVPFTPPVDFNGWVMLGFGPFSGSVWVDDVSIKPAAATAAP